MPEENVLGFYQRGRDYYSVRSGVNKNGRNLDLNTLKTLFFSLFRALESEGYFQQHFGYDCVDDGFVAGALGPDIEAQLLLHLRKSSMWPISQHLDIYEEHDLFDMIEFLYDHVSKPIEGRYHNWNNCGMHYSVFESKDGREHFRTNVNVLLSSYANGFVLSEEGEIQHAPDSGFERIMGAAIPTDRDRDIKQKIEDAKLRFLSRSSSIDTRRDAIRELADVLELLRADVKTHLASADESDLFNLANNFAIRHHNGLQKAEYDTAIWHSWMFYYYLATIHALLRLIERAKNGG